MDQDTKASDISVKTVINQKTSAVIFSILMNIIKFLFVASLFVAYQSYGEAAKYANCDFFEITRALAISDPSHCSENSISGYTKFLAGNRILTSAFFSILVIYSSTNTVCGVIGFATNEQSMKWTNIASFLSMEGSFSVLSVISLVLVNAYDLQLFLPKVKLEDSVIRTPTFLKESTFPAFLILIFLVIYGLYQISCIKNIATLPEFDVDPERKREDVEKKKRFYRMFDNEMTTRGDEQNSIKNLNIFYGILFILGGILIMAAFVTVCVLSSNIPDEQIAIIIFKGIISIISFLRMLYIGINVIEKYNWKFNYLIFHSIFYFFDANQILEIQSKADFNVALFWVFYGFAIFFCIFNIIYVFIIESVGKIFGKCFKEIRRIFFTKDGQKILLNIVNCLTVCILFCSFIAQYTVGEPPIDSVQMKFCPGFTTDERNILTNFYPNNDLLKVNNVIESLMSIESNIIIFILTLYFIFNWRFDGKLITLLKLTFVIFYTAIILTLRDDGMTDSLMSNFNFGAFEINSTASGISVVEKTKIILHIIIFYIASIEYGKSKNLENIFMNDNIDDKEENENSILERKIENNVELKNVELEGNDKQNTEDYDNKQPLVWYNSRVLSYFLLYFLFYFLKSSLDSDDEMLTITLKDTPFKTENGNVVVDTSDLTNIPIIEDYSPRCPATPTVDMTKLEDYLESLFDLTLATDRLQENEVVKENMKISVHKTLDDMIGILIAPILLTVISFWSVEFGIDDSSKIKILCFFIVINFLTFLHMLCLFATVNGINLQIPFPNMTVVVGEKFIHTVLVLFLSNLIAIFEIINTKAEINVPLPQSNE